MERKGIDISYHQGIIDWEKVRPQIDFAIIRLGYGNNNVDTQAIRNMDECERLGIPYGVYWFSYAYTEEMARNESECVAQLIKGRRLAYPIAWDFEGDSLRFAKRSGVNVTPDLLKRMTYAFCRNLESKRYYVSVYTNHDYMTRMFDKSVFIDFDMWYARYISKCPIKTNMWQYTSTLRVEGIKGFVDGNKCYLDYPKIMQNKRLNNF